MCDCLLCACWFVCVCVCVVEPGDICFPQSSSTSSVDTAPLTCPGVHWWLMRWAHQGALGICLSPLHHSKGYTGLCMWSCLAFMWGWGWNRSSCVLSRPIIRGGILWPTGSVSQALCTLTSLAVLALLIVLLMSRERVKSWAHVCISLWNLHQWPQAFEDRYTL